METVLENETKPVGGAPSILMLGLAFSYVTHRGRSVVAGMVAHVLNTLA